MVTDDPLAMGVRISVVVLGSLGTRLASTFCWASMASFESGRDGEDGMVLSIEGNDLVEPSAFFWASRANFESGLPLLVVEELIDEEFGFGSFGVGVFVRSIGSEAPEI